MSRLVHKLSPTEARALRERALADSATLDFFLRQLGDTYPWRVYLSAEVPSRLVVRIGTDPRLTETRIERYRMGLWPQFYFRIGPSCRVCGERIRDGEKALGFLFSPTRDITRTRKGFVHLVCPELHS